MSDDIDNLTLGMLLALGTGVATGASLSYAVAPFLGWMVGSMIVLLGVGYDVWQR